MKTITVTISDGYAVVSTDGFVGAECLAATAELEKALGNQTDSEMTTEGRLRSSETSRVRA